MKTISIFIIGLLSLIAISCSSDEPKHTGPWEITYHENFSELHNPRSTYKTWLSAHKDCFVDATFITKEGEVTEYSGTFPETEYKSYYNLTGDVYWVEIIENASEQEIQQMVNDFEAFSVTGTLETPSQGKRDTYATYTASYRPLDNKSI